jgi:hypothetical protein
MSKIESEIDSQGRGQPPRKLIFFAKLIFSLVNLGIAATFLFIAIWVLAKFRVEVLAGQVYEWPLMVRVISIIYVVVSVMLLVSQLLVLFGGRIAGRFLVASLAFFFVAYTLEMLMAANEYGFRQAVVYKLVCAIMFLAWVISNHYFWSRIRPYGRLKGRKAG